MVAKYEYTQCVRYTTSYLAPTNHRGARVRVVGGSHKAKTYPWRHEMSVKDNHEQAFENYLRDVDAEPSGVYRPVAVTVSDAPRGYYFLIDPAVCS